MHSRSIHYFSLFILQHLFPHFTRLIFLLFLVLLSSSLPASSPLLIFSSSPGLTWTTETATGPGVLTSCQSRTPSKSISRWTCVHCTSSHWWAPKVATQTAWVMSLPSDTGSSTAATAATGWAGMIGREGRWACPDNTVWCCFSF